MGCDDPGITPETLMDGGKVGEVKRLLQERMGES